jgi:hypothetical protein
MPNGSLRPYIPTCPDSHSVAFRLHLLFALRFVSSSSTSLFFPSVVFPWPYSFLAWPSFSQNFFLSTRDLLPKYLKREFKDFCDQICSGFFVWGKLVPRQSRLLKIKYRSSCFQEIIEQYGFADGFLLKNLAKLTVSINFD